MGLPKSKKKNGSIFVVVDKLSKAAHFILVKSTYKEVRIVDIFLKEILYSLKGGDIRSNILMEFHQKP